MTSPQSTATDRTKLEQYHQRLGPLHLAPLWERLARILTPEPQVRSIPYLWHYDALRPVLLQSGELISAEEAERRVLILENPELAGQSAITESLFAGLQLVMPGEVAPAHRHSPAALRFIIEGEGAYTSVDGEKVYMLPGDFVVTPSWAWHEHGHDKHGPFVWLDVLDLPTVRSAGPIFFEQYSQDRYPERTDGKVNRYRFGMNLLPLGYQRKSLSSPVLSYPYATARDALERIKGHSEFDPAHGLKMQYIDPTTGGAALPTLSAFLQLLPGGFGGARYRSTESTVFCVTEGRGTVRTGSGAGAATLEFGPRDIFVVPCWQAYAIEAREESVLFSASDRIVQQKLGIWREDRG